MQAHGFVKLFTFGDATSHIRENFFQPIMSRLLRKKVQSLQKRDSVGEQVGQLRQCRSKNFSTDRPVEFEIE